MVTSLDEINPVIPDNIYKPMFLSDSARPNAWPKEFKRFGLTSALKRVSHDCFDQLKNTKSRLSVRFYPVSQILPKLWLENGFRLGRRMRLF